MRTLAFCAILCMVFQGAHKGPKKITEDEIKGALSVQSQAGIGTVFNFTLPIET